MLSCVWVRVSSPTTPPKHPLQHANIRMRVCVLGEKEDREDRSHLTPVYSRVVHSKPPCDARYTGYHTGLAQKSTRIHGVFVAIKPRDALINKQKLNFTPCIALLFRGKQNGKRPGNIKRPRPGRPPSLLLLLPSPPCDKNNHHRR